MREINQKVAAAASIENKYLLPGHMTPTAGIHPILSVTQYLTEIFALWPFAVFPVQK